MFTQELRFNTQQVVRVGILVAKNGSTGYPRIPVTGALLNWYWWRYLVKANEAVVDIVNNTWRDVPQCGGLYFLTLKATDVNVLGPLTLYIYDTASLGKPILQQFMVIGQNLYDSKYGNNTRLKTETEAKAD
jgi:hypothetical protein